VPFIFGLFVGLRWFGIIRRYVNNSGLPLGFTLSPFGSTVTNTESICDRVFASLDFKIQRCLLMSSQFTGLETP
jgi:hypothetical protein